MSTPFTIYKLIVLYMLQNTEDTLTNSQISEFILDREYTNYFHLQQAISELVEADLVTMDTRSNTSHYRITEDGKKTLSFFQKDISPEIKQEVREYLKSTGFKAHDGSSLRQIIISPSREPTLYDASSSKRETPSST